MPRRTERSTTPRPRGYRSRRWGLVVGLALIVLAIVPGLMTLSGRSGGSSTFADLQPGDCIILSALAGGGVATPHASVEVVHERADCAWRNTADYPTPITYEVGTIGLGSQSCPNAYYLDYFTTGIHNPVDRPREHTACLVPMFPVGVCVQENPDTHGYDEVECTPEALFRIMAAHQVDDPEVCADGTQPMEFPLPARTYCLAEVL